MNYYARAKNNLISIAGPIAWNSLPHSRYVISFTTSTAAFKRHLKTHIFLVRTFSLNFYVLLITALYGAGGRLFVIGALEVF